MKAAEFVSRASATQGIRSLAAQALAGQIDRLGRNRFALVLPLARKPFETGGSMHFHQGFELVFQCLGVSRWELQDGHVEVARSALLLIPRGVPHVERLGEGTDCSCNINIYVSQDLVTCHGLAWTAPSSREMLGKGQTLPVAPALLFDMLAEAVAAFERGGAASPILRGLLLSTSSLLHEGLVGPVDEPSEGSRLVSLCRQETLRYLCSSSLNVGWLAERLNCNPDYLSHVFRHRTGRRLNEFINAERIKLGRYLLQSSTLSVGEVAASCGYSDPNYFSRLFRRAAGKPPGEFRAGVRHAAETARPGRPAAAHS